MKKKEYITPSTETYMVQTVSPELIGTSENPAIPGETLSKDTDWEDEEDED